MEDWEMSEFIEIENFRRLVHKRSQIERWIA